MLTFVWNNNNNNNNNNHHHHHRNHNRVPHALSDWGVSVARYLEGPVVKQQSLTTLSVDHY